MEVAEVTAPLSNGTFSSPALLPSPHRSATSWYPQPYCQLIFVNSGPAKPSLLSTAGGGKLALLSARLSTPFRDLGQGSELLCALFLVMEQDSPYLTGA